MVSPCVSHASLIKGEGYAEKTQPILTGDMIMKFDLNMWAI